KVLIAGPLRGPVTRAACCAGSCGEFLDDAIKSKAQLFLTGELRHHDAIRAADAGMTVICTLHSNSERAELPRLKKMLAKRLPDLAIEISRADRDPFSIA